MVVAVKHGTAHVEPDPGVADELRVKLGWADAGAEAYPLQEHSIATVTDDGIWLRGER